MTTATSSNGKGAATAAPDLQEYVELERLISESENQVISLRDEAIRARWHFGRKLLEERGGRKQLPSGRIAEVCVAIGRGRTEILFRVKFAERYTTEDEVSNALDTYGSWYGITKRGLYEKRDPDPEPQPSKSTSRKGSEGGKANHQLKAKRRQDDRPADELYYMRERVNRAASELEWYDLEGFAWSEWTQELVDDAFDDLTRLQKWVDHALDVTIAHMSDLSRQRRLWLLRERSTDPSSTQNERATAARALEKLQARPKIRASA